MAEPAERYLIPKEIAAEYRVTLGTVYHWITHGIPVAGHVVRLRAVRVGIQWRIAESAWREWLHATNPDTWREIARQEEVDRKAHEKADRELAELLAPRRRRKARPEAQAAG
jgi:hypothetical protein